MLRPIQPEPLRISWRTRTCKSWIDHPKVRYETLRTHLEPDGIHIHDMDYLPTTASQLRVAVQEAWVALSPVRLLTLVWTILRRGLSLLRVVVTLTINKPFTMPLIPSTDLQNLKIFQYQLFLLTVLLIDTCYSGTPWPQCTLPASARKLLTLALPLQN